MMLRSAWRGVARNPGFSALVTVTLALGIGSTTTMFSVLYVVVARPMPFPAQERLVTVWEADADHGVRARRLSPATFADLEARQTVFEAIGTLPNWAGRTLPFNVVGPERTERVQGVYASSGIFAALGVPPLLGQPLAPEDDRHSGRRRVVISHAYWRDRFAGDPAVLGRAVEVDTFRGGPFTVVGVMPPGFDFPRHASLWLSLADWGGGPMPRPDAAERCCGWYTTIARLKPGITRDRAAAELTAIAREISSRHPGGAPVTSIDVVPLRETLVGEHRMTLIGMFGAVACVLLIACANVANLLVSRGVSRRREIATRRALGATLWHIARQLLGESGILAGIGAVAGLLISAWGLALLSRQLADRVPFIEHLELDWTVVAFTAAVAVAVTLVCGLAPLVEWGLTGWRAHGQSESGPSKRLRQVLVVGEIALAVVLVATAGLFLRTVAKLHQVDLGYSIDRTLVVSTDLTTSPLRSRGSAAALLDRLLPELMALPGVRAAGAATGQPLGGRLANQAITREGDPVLPAVQSPQVVQTAATPGYFPVMGIAVRQGRLVDERDTAEGELVAVVNETAARRYWPGEDPIGKRFTIGSAERFGFFRPPASPGALEWRRIVGVVSDVRSAGFAAEVQPEVYYNYTQFPIYEPAIVIRTVGDAPHLASAVRDRVHATSPATVITEIRTLQEIATESIAGPRLRALGVGALSLMALGLGALGIYGVMSYTVARQTREIGIKIALGAGRAQVARGVLYGALRLTLAGGLLGIVGAYLVSRWISSLLFGVQGMDPPAIVGAAVMIVSTTLLAAFWPTRRAVRIDPAVALRAE